MVNLFLLLLLFGSIQEAAGIICYTSGFGSRPYTCTWDCCWSLYGNCCRTPYYRGTGFIAGMVILGIVILCCIVGGIVGGTRYYRTTVVETIDHPPQQVYVTTTA